MGRPCSGLRPDSGEPRWLGPDPRGGSLSSETRSGTRVAASRTSPQDGPEGVTTTLAREARPGQGSHPGAHGSSEAALELSSCHAQPSSWMGSCQPRWGRPLLGPASYAMLRATVSHALPLPGEAPRIPGTPLSGDSSLVTLAHIASCSPRPRGPHFSFLRQVGIPFLPAVSSPKFLAFLLRETEGCWRRAAPILTALTQ